MPMQRTIEVYTYDELSERAKENARNWYRRIDDFSSFHGECILDDFQEVLKDCGFTGTKIYYSGFCSQGDGACFEGAWYASLFDVKKMANYEGDRRLFPIIERLKTFAEENPFSKAELRHRGNYCHEISVVINWYPSDEEDAENSCADDAENSFEDITRDLMRCLYRQLESEYDFQNSDETVADNIRSNEYVFDVNGKRI